MLNNQVYSAGEACLLQMTSRAPVACHPARVNSTVETSLRRRVVVPGHCSSQRAKLSRSVNEGRDMSMCLSSRNTGTGHFWRRKCKEGHGRREDMWLLSNRVFLCCMYSQRESERSADDAARVVRVWDFRWRRSASGRTASQKKENPCSERLKVATSRTDRDQHRQPRKPRCS